MDEPKAESGSNVVPIKKGGNEKKETENVKMKSAEIHLAIADAIKRSPASILELFPRNLGVLEPEPGRRLVVEIDETDDSVRIMSPEYVRDAIIGYTSSELGTKPDFLLTHRQAMEAAAYWISLAVPLDPATIRSTRWKGEHGLTYRRLPWELRAGDTTTWDDLLSRMSNVQAFIQWVGSLFVEASSLQNYVWIYGGGGDGKGSINRFLSSVFGMAYRSKQPPGRYGDKFWTHGILGARLVVFPDCTDASFVTSGLFKSLTGGDPVDVEAKGSMSFTARLNAKYMVLSQARPAISSERADLRRIIYCELDKCPEIDPRFEDKLWEEGGAFLSACVREYAYANPTHGPIRSDMDEIMGIVETREEGSREVFERWFVEDDTSFVDPTLLQRMLRQEWPKSRASQLAFLEWLERVKGIRRRRVRVADQSLRPYRYEGVSLNVALLVPTPGLGNVHSKHYDN